MSVWPHTLLVLAALVPCGVSFAAQTAPIDDAPLRQIIDTQVAAWNRGDGDAWAASFAEDATFINIRGQIAHGRAGVAALHRMILTGPYQGSHVEIHIRRILPLSGDTALMETDHTVTNFHALPPGVVATSPGTLEAHMNYIAQRSAGGSWHILFAQNTAVLPGVPHPPQR